MTIVRLEDVCDRGSSNLKQSDIENNSGDYPIYGAAGYIGNVDFYHQSKPYVAVVKDGAGIGRTYILPAESSVIGTMQYLLPKDNVLPEFLYYIVKNLHLEKYYTGATIPHIYFKDYKNEAILYVDKEKQKEVVNVLQSIERIIDIQEQELRDLDELIKARFVELFGDCNKERLGDFCSTHARIGWQKLTRAEFLEKGDYYLITGWDFDTQNHKVDFSKCYYVSKERYEQDKKLMLKEGDVLLTKDGTLGKVAIIEQMDKPATLNGHIFVIRPLDERLIPEFLVGCFISDDFKYQMEANKTGSTIVGVTQKSLLEFKIPVAPIEKQIEYKEFAKQLDKSKSVCQKKINLYQELLDKKMDEYFNPKKEEA